MPTLRHKLFFLPQALNTIILDGSTEFFSDGDDLLDIANAWTVAGWVKYEGNFFGDDDTLFSASQDDTSLENRIVIVQNENLPSPSPCTFRIFDSAGGNLKQFDLRWIFGNDENGILNIFWLHLAMTWDGTDLKVYIDAVLTEPETKVFDNAGTMSDSPDRKIDIGVNEPQTNGQWDGLLGHWAIFDVALLSQEIDEIWNGGLALNLTSNFGAYVSSGDLVHYWRFGDNEAVSPADLGVGPTDRTVTATGISAPANIEKIDLPDGTRGEDRSMDMDGSFDHYQHFNERTIDIADVWSISLWSKNNIRPTTLRTLVHIEPASPFESGIRFDWDPSTANDEFEVILRDSSGTIFKRYEYNDWFGTDASPNVDWVHTVVTWNGTDLKAYRDSVLITADTKTTDDSGTMANDIRKMTWAADLTDDKHWDGPWGHFAIWDVELDINDILSIFNPPVGKPFRIDLRENTGTYDKGADLQHYWKPGFSSTGVQDQGRGSFSILLDQAGTLLNSDIVIDSPLARFIISSAANQTFNVDDGITPISPITITDNFGAITTGNNIRIRIPFGTGPTSMTFDSTDLNASITGNASSKVSQTVTLEDQFSTVVINVSTNFVAGDQIIISGLGYHNFDFVETADNLELEVLNDNVVTNIDDKTVQIDA